jgi:bifunctional NMN adenylyltransferase/nudix hydrolase
MMQPPRKGVGVVVGRFQVADLHEGHLAVLAEADKHSKLCVFVGVQPAQLNTKSDPLDYPTREQMIKEACQRAQVFPMVDQYTDTGWSSSLDTAISALYPRDTVTLYGGRDSFRGRYLGKHPTVEIDPVSKLSGTDLRDIDGSKVENHASFRRGLIYAAYNRYTPIYPCVDVICSRRGFYDKKVEVLVGRRASEGGAHRFPGGHVDPGDDTDLAAAKRELAEETGVEAGHWTHVWSGAIKTWRDRQGGGVWRTSLFHCRYAHGSAKGADDLDGVGWVSVDQLAGLGWVDDHAKLAGIYLAWLKPEERR